MDQDDRLHRVSEHLSDLRVSVGHLEARADETRRWIDAHRARTTQIEAATTQRFDQLHARVDATDRRIMQVHHDLALTQRQVSTNLAEIQCLRRGKAMSKGLEIALPLVLVAAALAYKIPLADLLASIR